MTTAKKIHLQDPEGEPGLAVCGRRATGARITSEILSASCTVCRTFAPPTVELLRASVDRTVLDHLGQANTDLLFTPRAASQQEDPAMIRARARGKAKARAYYRLAAGHVEEFRRIYEEEVAAALAEEEELALFLDAPPPGG